MRARTMYVYILHGNPFYTGVKNHAPQHQTQSSNGHAKEVGQRLQPGNLGIKHVNVTAKPGENNPPILEP